MRKGVLLILLLLSLFFSCATPPAHQGGWVNNPYDKNYTEDEYLLVIGSGSSYQKAVDNARMNLAYVFSSQVEALTAITTIDSSDGERFDELFEHGTISSNVDDLVDAHVFSSMTDQKGQTFVRFGLHRATSAQFYQHRVEALEKELALVYRSASANELERYAQLAGSYPLAQEAQELSDRIWVLTKEQRPNYLFTLRSELQGLAQTITVGVQVVSETRPEVLKAGFEDTLQRLGFRQGAGRYTLTITYDSEAVTLQASPYAYERYTLSVILGEKDTVIRSYTLSERIAALEQGDAKAKALASALHNGSETLIALLSQ